MRRNSPPSAQFIKKTPLVFLPRGALAWNIVPLSLRILRHTRAFVQIYGVRSYFLFVLFDRGVKLWAQKVPLARFSRDSRLLCHRIKKEEDLKNSQLFSDFVTPSSCFLRGRRKKKMQRRLGRSKRKPSPSYLDGKRERERGRASISCRNRNSHQSNTYLRGEVNHSGDRNPPPLPWSNEVFVIEGDLSGSIFDAFRFSPSSSGIFFCLVPCLCWNMVEWVGKRTETMPE